MSWVKVEVTVFETKLDEQGYSRELNRREIAHLEVDATEWQKLPELVALALRGTTKPPAYVEMAVENWPPK